MPNAQPAQNPKHLKDFWPIFIIIIVALVAAGVILFYTSGNELQDSINSSNFFHKVEVVKKPVKTQTNSTAAVAQ